MGDFTLPPASTLIVGMTGSGKSTFAYEYLKKSPAACRFVFDNLGRAGTRLGIRPCYTAREVELALGTRWVIFNPARMFEDTRAAFRWFCHWSYQASQRGPGKKLFLVDELWQFCTADSIPKELQLVANAGREENLELVTATQQPELINPSLTGAATEMVCFRLTHPEGLRVVDRLGADRRAIAALPLGSYFSYDRLHGGPVRTGRVF